MFEKIAQSKAKIDALRPLQGNLIQQIRDYYKIGLTYSSNALEGNSLTETETKVLLEDGLTVGGKPIRDYYEATGHAKAYDYIYTLLQGELGETQLKNLHRLFYSLIDEAKAGEYRQGKVIISGSKYPVPPPDQIDSLMNEFFHWMSTQEKQMHPVEFAAKAHKGFVFIHPFVDGNGRVARLLMNLCLLRHGYTLAIIPPVLRGEYLALLEKAHEDDTDFVNFIAERVEETQKDLLRLLK